MLGTGVSSVFLLFFFLFFGREILQEIRQNFFGLTEQRLTNFGEKFGAFFVRKFVPRKTLSCELRSADAPSMFYVFSGPRT